MDPHSEIIRVRVEALTDIVRNGFDRIDNRLNGLERDIRALNEEVADLKEWRAARDATTLTERGGKDWHLKVLVAVFALVGTAIPLLELAAK